jgi:hypothetical protein
MLSDARKSGGMIAPMLSCLRGFLLASLLLSAPMALAQDAAPATPTSASNHFHSDALRLSFDIPEDIEVHPDLLDKIDQNLKKSGSTPTGQPCVTMPLIGFNPKVIRRVYLYQTDSACTPDGLTQDHLRIRASAMLTAFLKSMGKPSVASPIDYDLGGKSSVVVSGNVFSEVHHGIVFGEIGCVVLDGYSACWLFVSGSVAKVARLAEMPVRFDGREPTPIIPADASRLAMPDTVTYHDDARHFTFTYPGSFVDAQQRTTDILAKKTDDAQGREKTIIECMRTSLTGDELTDSGHSTILIFNVNAECQNLKISSSVLSDFAKGVAKGVAKTAKKSTLSNPVMYSLAGHDAVLMRATLTTAAGLDASIVDACAIVSGDILCWQFFSTSPERLSQMVNSQVAFNGQLAVPVVPPELQKKQ